MPKPVSKKKSPTCNRVLALFKRLDRLDGLSLPKEVAGHLKACPSCRRHYTSLKATLTIFGTPVNVPTPKAVRGYVEERLTAQAEHSRA